MTGGLAVLKNGRARAIRFTTLDSICSPSILLSALSPSDAACLHQDGGRQCRARLLHRRPARLDPLTGRDQALASRRLSSGTSSKSLPGSPAQ